MSGVLTVGMASLCTPGKDGGKVIVASRWSLQRDERGMPIAILENATTMSVNASGPKEALHTAISERTRLAVFREEIGLALARGMNMRGMAQDSAEATVRHLDAAFVRIWTVSSDGKEFIILQASAGIYTRLDGSHSRIPVGQLKIGLIAQEATPHLTNNVQNDPRINDRDWARREGLVSFAGYPLLVEDRVVGVSLGMFSRKTLPRSTIETLSFVADTIAQGIERKRAEEALRQSETQHRENIQTIPAMVWSAAPDGSSTFVNSRWTEYTGLSVEETAGSGLLSALHIEDCVLHSTKWRTSVATGQPFEDEVRSRRGPDGEYRWFLVRGVPLRDEQGQIVKWYGTLTDIEDRKRAECQEQERLRQLEADLAHMNRVSTMGELAASLSHEISQPVAAAAMDASACLRWLQRESPDIGEACDAVSRVGKEIKRTADIIERNRSLFKRDTPQREPVDLNRNYSRDRYSTAPFSGSPLHLDPHGVRSGASRCGS